MTEDKMNEDDMVSGNEYLANLDFIEGVEKLKEGYESEAHCSDTENESSKKNSTMKTGPLCKNTLFKEDSSSGEGLLGPNKMTKIMMSSKGQLIFRVFCAHKFVILNIDTQQAQIGSVAVAMRMRCNAPFLLDIKINIFKLGMMHARTGCKRSAARGLRCEMCIAPPRFKHSIRRN